MVPKPKIAVIFLPGIMGSPLENRTNGGTAWPAHKMGLTNPLNIDEWYSATYYEKMRKFVDLKSSDFCSLTRAMKADMVYSRIWGWTINNVAETYHGFLKMLLSRKLKDTNGENLILEEFDYLAHVINYDWSRPIKETSLDVGGNTYEFVTQNKCDWFIYVTHSMGGIVGMASLADMNLELGPWIQKKCLGMVRVACPVIGAPETTARLVRGILPDGSITGPIASTILGNTGRKFSLFAACLPGVASLLPQLGSQSPINIHHVEAILNYHFGHAPLKKDFSEMEPDEASALQYGNVFLIELKKQFGESIFLANQVTSKLYENHQLFSKYVSAVVLIGKETLDSYIVNESPNHPYINPTWKSDVLGDSTVPIGSQACLSGHKVYVDGGIDHANAFSDSQTWPHIIDAMNALIK